MFGNPVAGIIKPFGSPPDGTFRVTAPFGSIDPFHPTPHDGVDIGNGKCGEPLLAMTTGKVSLAGTVPGSTALIIRIISDDHPDFEPAVAHCATIEVKVGQHVTRGQRIGTLGATGTTACHCHIGLKQKIAGVWKSIDPWPYLDQNEEDDVLQGTGATLVANRQGVVKGDNTRFRSSPFIQADNIIAQFNAGAIIRPDFIVIGGLVGLDPHWYAGFMTTPKGQEFGYFHVSVIAPLVPIELTGFSQAQLDEAAKKAASVAASSVAAAAVTESKLYS